MKSAGNAVSPTSTIAQARVMLYQPSQRPRHREGDWQETSFGRCRVAGRLGQRHADVVEAILYCAEKRRDVSDGGVELLVDPARIRKTLSDSRYSLAQIQKLLSELRASTIEIETPDLARTGDRIIGGLIDHVIPSPMMRPDPLTGGERSMWRVRLGIALVMLLERDLALYYNPAPIARLRHGIGQAVARHILSHKNEPAGGWHLDTVILAVARQATGKALRDARFRLREDAEQLEQIGLVIDGNRVRRVSLTAPGRRTAAR
ncbi:ABC transporter ATPase [Hahella sp. KA22]|uniref:ABC transporter ATPase n=1 Tax=Hahella sp. KA22 TaxID=1628392 RepID=UPI000FDD3619|nr:ABC transporter ATPase [Hahella sp. KA22]AZZ94721.1 ABC transporter ATPase [Hahella sp. KA22]QAY58095.1 ABC transporter ATPase [Hahella sp. KA22]